LPARDHKFRLYKNVLSRPPGRILCHDVRGALANATFPDFGQTNRETLIAWQLAKTADPKKY
jgi:hypothetical protein